ncbi:hypothetical protein JW877_04950 [bacterium]|nr:hypothetical protein [bacterium]
MKKYILCFCLLLLLSCSSEKTAPPGLLLPERLRTLENIELELGTIPVDFKVIWEGEQFDEGHFMVDFLGEKALVDYPSTTLIKNLKETIQKDKDNPGLYLRLAKAQLMALKFGDAEESYFKYAEKEPNRHLSYRTLIDFYRNRLAYDRAFEIYEKYFAFLKDQKDQVNLLTCFYDMVSLCKEHLLEKDFEGYFEQALHIFPDDFGIFEEYIDYLTIQNQYDKALLALKRYRNRYPDISFFIIKKADLLYAQEQKEEILPFLRGEIEKLSLKQLYQYPDLTEGYLDYQAKIGDYWDFQESLKEKGIDQEATAIYILFQIYRRDYGDYECKTLLDNWVREKPEYFRDHSNLEAVAGLYMDVGFPEEAANLYYNLYLLNPPEGETVFYRLLQALEKCQHNALTWGSKNINNFLNIEIGDRNPGILGGLLSLDFNLSGMEYKTRDFQKTSLSYFNDNLKFKLTREFKKHYPESPYLEELELNLIETLALYGEIELTTQYAGSFEKDHPNSILLYDCYRALIRVQPSALKENLEYYKRMLNLAIQRNDTTEYTQIFSEAVSYLTGKREYQEILRLYWEEIKRNPQLETLYIEFLDFVQNNNLLEEEIRLYQKALDQFKTKSWYDKLSRFYIRQREWRRFRETVEEVIEVMDSEELTDFLQNFVSGYYQKNYDEFTYDIDFYEKVHLIALKRFPFNPVLISKLSRFYDYYGFTDYDKRILSSQTAEYAQRFYKFSKLYFCFDPFIRERLLYRLSEHNSLTAYETIPLKSELNPAELLFSGEYYSWGSRYEEALPFFREYIGYYPGKQQENEYTAELLRSLDFSFKYERPQYARMAVGINQQLSLVYPQNKQYYIIAGEILMELGRFEEAFPKWNQLLLIRKGSPDSYLELATLYWDYYQFNQALATFMLCRETFNDHSLFAKQLAAVYESQEDYQNALLEYIKIISRNRYDYSAKQRLSYFRREHDLGRSIELAFEDEISNNREDFNILLAYGEYLDYIDQPEKQTRLYRENITAYKSIYFLDELRWFFERKGLSRDEEATLKQMVKLEPLKRHYENLILFYEEKLEYSKAQKTYEGLIQQYKNSNYLLAGIYQEAGDFCWRHNDYDNALIHYETGAFLSKGEQKPYRLNLLADKLIKQGHTSKAKKILELLIEEDPLNEEYYATLGMMFQQKNDLDGLIELYQNGINQIKSAELSRESQKYKLIDFRLKLLRTLEKMERFQEAQDQYIEIINLNPLDKTTINEASLFSQKHKIFDRLLDYYEKTAQKSYKDYRWNVVNSYLYDSHGEFARAAEELEKAIQNEPHKIWLYENLAEQYVTLNENMKLIPIYDKLYTLSNGEIGFLLKQAEVHKRLGDLQNAQEILYNILTKTSKYDEYLKVSQTLYQWALYDSAMDYYQRAIKRLEKNLYYKPIARWELELLVDIKVALSDLVGLNELLEGLWSRYDTELNSLNQRPSADRGHYERWKISNSKYIIEEVYQSYFAQAVSEYATDGQVQEIMARMKVSQSSQQFSRLAELYSNFAQTAGLADLQENLLIQQYQSRGEFYSNLHPVIQYYKERGAFKKCIEILLSSKLKYTYNEGQRKKDLACFYWLTDDKKSELKAFQELYSPKSYQYFENYFFNEAYKYDRTILMDVPPKISLINFMIEKGDKGSALDMLSRMKQTASWINTKSALVYAYFGDYSREAESAFLDALNIDNIGFELKQDHQDWEQGLLDEPWFKLSFEYGKYLYRKGEAGKRWSDFAWGRIEDHPLSASEYKMLGDFFTREQEYTLAEEQYNYALTLMPNSNDIFIARARLKYQQGEPEQVKNEMNRIIEKQNTPLDHYLLYFEKMNDFGLGEAGLSALQNIIYERYLSLTPYEREYYSEKVVRYYLEKKGTNEAVLFYKKLCELKPSLLESYSLALDSGLLPIQEHPYFIKKAIEHSKNRDKFNISTEIGWRYRLVDYYILSKDFPEALASLEGIESQFSLKDTLVFKKARILFALNNHDEAHELLAEWLEEGEEYFNDYNRVYRFCKDLGEDAMADNFMLKYYELSIRKGDCSADTHLELARIYLNQNKPGKADSLLRKIYQLAPGNTHIINCIASVYEEFEQYQKALGYRELYSQKSFSRENQIKILMLQYKINPEKELSILRGNLEDIKIPRSARMKLLELYLDILANKSDVVKNNEFLFIQQKYNSQASPDNIISLAMARLSLINEKPSIFLETLEKVADQSYYPYEALLLLAQYYRDNGHNERATEYYLKAIYYQPDDFSSRYQLFSFLFETRQYLEALGLFPDEVLGTENYWADFGYWYQENLRYWLDHLDLSQEQKTEFCFRLGSCFESLEFPEKALVLYELEMEFAPEDRKAAIEKVIDGKRASIREKNAEKSKALTLDESLHLF